MEGTVFRLHDPKNPKDIPKNDPLGRPEKALGRWVAEKAFNGIRKRFYGLTQKEAKDKLKAHSLEVDTGNYIASNNIKVKQWSAMWMETYKKASVSNVTYDNYTHYIAHLDNILGDHALQDVGIEHAQKFINELIRKGLSPRSIKDIASVARQCFEKAKELKYIKDNPVDGVEKPKVLKKTKTVLNAIDLEVFKDLNHNHPMYPALLMQVRMGLRKGEVLGLRQDDIDLDEGTVFIHQAVSKTSTGKPYVKPCPKNDPSIRKIPMHPEVIEALRRYSYVTNDNNLAFTTRTGNIIGVDNYLKYTKNLFNGKVTNHELRHTFITNMCNLGVNPTITAQLAGHGDTRMVNNVYNHPDMAKLREAIEKQ